MQDAADGVVVSLFLARLSMLGRENEQLQHALDSRIVIEQAKGAISVRSCVDVDTAFEMLRAAARNSRRNIHDCATQVVAHAGDVSAIDQLAAGR